MNLDPQPADGLVDEPVTWWVQGVPAGTTVRLTISGADAAGRSWRSTGEYPVGDDGRLLIADSDRPWWSMTTDARPPVTFTAPDDQWACTAEATNGGTTARTTVRRRFGTGTPPYELSGDRWRLLVYPAATRAPGVLLIPGSTGIAPLAPRAALLAAHGYSAAVLGYMQEPGLPQSMRQIPTEVLGEAGAAFGARDEVQGARLVVWAASVGTELALAALSSPDPLPVRGVVAVSPSDVVCAGAGRRRPPTEDVLVDPRRDRTAVGAHARRAAPRPGGPARAAATSTWWPDTVYRAATPHRVQQPRPCPRRRSGATG